MKSRIQRGSITGCARDTNSKIAAVIIIVILIAVGLYAVSANLIPNPLNAGQSNSTTNTSSFSSSGSTTSGSNSSSFIGGVNSSTTTSTPGSSSIGSSTGNSSSSSKVSSFVLQVAAELQNGSSISGLSVQISSSAGKVLNSSSVPARFNLAGGSYNITVNGGSHGYLFDRWKSGQASRSVLVTLNNNTSLMALYRLAGLQTINVLGRDVEGRTVAGTVAHFYRNGALNGSDVIPANFTASYGDNISVIAYGAQSLSFQYWNNNKSEISNPYNFTDQGNMSVTAYYQPGPPPLISAGPGNHTITVISHTLDGGELVGAYFQVRIHGVWNNYVQGWTPATVQVPSGWEELVMYHCARVDPCMQRLFVYRYYNDTQHTLTRWNVFNLQSDVTFNSFYQIMYASNTVYVHVDAVNASNHQNIYNCTCGALITIYQNGVPMAQSLTPYSFYLFKGQNYTVHLGTITGYTFVSWFNGSTSTNATLLPTARYVDSADKYVWDEDFEALYAKNGQSPGGNNTFSGGIVVIGGVQEIASAAVLIGSFSWISGIVASGRTLFREERDFSQTGSFFLRV